MALPPAVPREDLHLRRIELRGYRRQDGLYDIEAHMVDTKAHELTLASGRVVSPGERLHDMSIRLTVDDDLNVIDIAASTDASPFGICVDAPDTLQTLKGLRIGAGWSKAIRERLTGRKGCTHLTELLAPLGTVAFQTLAPVRLARPAVVDGSGKPRKIDSCYAYASDREIVRERWPMYYDGPAGAAGAGAAGEGEPT
jgi:hypothetical protein